MHDGMAASQQRVALILTVMAGAVGVVLLSQAVDGGWSVLIEKFGLPLAFLLALSYFIYKAVWPFFVRVYDTLLARLEADQRVIEKMAQDMVNAMRDMSEQQREVAVTLKEVSERVRKE